MFIKFGKREHMQLYILLILVIDLASIGWIALQPEDTLTLSQFFIAEGLHVFFHVDMLSKIFSVLIAFVWLMVGIASFEYMAHEKNEQRFYCFYLVVGGVLSALAFSGNLLTMYVFYEMMTLTSMPLVMHNLSHEAIMAGLKYLFYSVAGAFMVLLDFPVQCRGRVLYLHRAVLLMNRIPLVSCCCCFSDDYWIRHKSRYVTDAWMAADSPSGWLRLRPVPYYPVSLRKQVFLVSSDRFIMWQAGYD